MRKRKNCAEQDWACRKGEGQQSSCLSTINARCRVQYGWRCCGVKANHHSYISGCYNHTHLCNILNTLKQKC